MGSADAGAPDAALPDLGTPDAEVPDAEIPDAEIPDAEIPDAEPADMMIIVVPDAEVPDAEVPDAEIPDAEVPDAEIPDAEIPDAEVPDLCGDGVQSPEEEGVDCGGICPPCPDPEPAPDPAAIDALPDPQGPTQFEERVAFLTEGPEATQHEVAPEALTPHRVAVMRGQVRLPGGAPLAGVQVSAPDEPDLGWAVTDADGGFDFVVNGGGRVRLRFQAPGYLAADREVEVPWADFAFVSDVVMTALDPVANPIAFEAPALQMAEGSPVVDADGARTPTLVIPPMVQGTMVMPDGSTVPLADGVIRITEYTVGEDGPDAMPAELPPMSAYTHAVELSVDAALEAGAASVRFDRPLYYYVDNYLGFPVGGAVPVGYYDRQLGIWVPSDDGRIIAVIGQADGLAELDLDGDGLADDTEALAELGFTDEERALLATRYEVGDSLWRSPIPHFTPWDCNWPYGPPLDAIRPDDEQLDPEGRGLKPTDPDRETDPCKKSGSILYCDQQVLGERIPIAGSDLALRYRSDQHPGAGGDHQLRIPLLYDVVPPSLQRIDVTIDIAGRRFRRSYPPLPNQTHTFHWDGLDAYGQPYRAKGVARIRVSFVYPAIYYGWATQTWRASFGRLGDGPIGGDPRVFEIELPKTYVRTLGRPTPPLHGGLSLDAHHRLSHTWRLLIRGDGSSGSGSPLGATAHVVARFGASPSARDVVAHRDGALTLLRDSGLIHFPVGALEGEADRYSLSFDEPEDGVGGPLSLGYRAGYDPRTDRLLITTERPDRVAAFDTLPPPLDPPPVFGGQDVAHRWLTGYEALPPEAPSPIGDAGPAAQATLRVPAGLAVDQAGNIYIADSYNSRIRRISPDGLIDTFAGTGAYAQGALDQPASEIALDIPEAVVACEDQIFIADTDNHRIIRVGPDGVGHAYAGTGEQGPRNPNFDISLAKDTAIYRPNLLACDGAGGLYYGSRYGWGVYHVDPTGYTRAVFGNVYAEGPVSPVEAGPSTGTRLPALQAPIAASGLKGITVLPDGRLVVVTEQLVQTYVWLVEAAQPFDPLNDRFIVPDGDEIHTFSGQGRHLRTLNINSGEEIRRFEYDAEGRLAWVRQAQAPDLELIWDNDRLVALSAGGEITTVETDGEGRIIRLSDRGGDRSLHWDPERGQLAEMVDPAGGRHRYTYDEIGRLTEDTDPTGGVTTLALIADGKGTRHVRVTDGDGLATDFISEIVDGARVRRVIEPTGAEHRVVQLPGGQIQATSPDGTTTQITHQPDPRWGYQQPYVGLMQITTPSGRSITVTQNKTVTLADETDPLSLVEAVTELTTQGVTTTDILRPGDRTATRISATGQITTTVFDDFGRAVSLQRDAEIPPLTWSYDALGRLRALAQGDQITRYDYDGDVTREIDPLGRITTRRQDAYGRDVEITRPSGHTTAQRYTGTGQLADVTLPSGATHQLSYNGRGELASYSPPGAPGVTRQYTDGRRWSGLTLPGGRRLERILDAQGRLQEITTTELITEMIYDDLTDWPQRLTARPVAGDHPGQDLLLHRDGGLVTGLDYAGADHPAVVQGQVRYTFNDQLLPTGRTLTAGDQIVEDSFQLDDSGAVIYDAPITFSRQGPGGAIDAASGAGFQWRYRFDGQGRIAGMDLSLNDAPLYSYGVTRDLAGQITEAEITAGGVAEITAYTRDLDGQITTAHLNGALSEQYAFDVNGNLAGGQYDAADRLTAWGEAIFAYDADGLPTTWGDLSLRYSTRGHLLAATLSDGGEIRYSVDPIGRRVARWGVGRAEQWLYGNPWSPFRPTHHRIDGGPWRRLIYHPDTGHLMAIREGEALYVVATDHLGSPRAVYDEAGAQLRRLDYSAFGEITADVGAFDLPLGFAGGLPDADTGLLRFVHRDYDPRLGRWTHRDPILFDGGQGNLYAYVGNNPVDYTDPYGLWCLGGSFYMGLGAGIKACADGDGFSICNEVGFGYGVGVEANPFGELDGEKKQLKGEISGGCGPAGAGGEITYNRDCGFGAGLKAGVGPFEVSTSGNKLTHDATDYVEDRFGQAAKGAKPKCGAQGKLVLEQCDRAPW